MKYISTIVITKQPTDIEVMPHLHACRELYWAAAVFPLKKLPFT